jgi:hypothetical protein
VFRIQVNDLIVEVDGTSLVGLPIASCQNVIRVRLGTLGTLGLLWRLALC